MSNPKPHHSSWFCRLHHDQQGSISIISVFAVMILAMLLGMVVNIGLQADSKVKMQNAADAATYSGGIVMARGMNSLAFTNHLLFDVFALTAFLREGRDNHSQALAEEILAAWDRTAPYFMWSEFSAFQNFSGTFAQGPLPFNRPNLGPTDDDPPDPSGVPANAIQYKVDRETEMVDTFCKWARAFSDRVLPTLEEILDNELIPEYQRTVTATVPGLAQMATNRIAQRHGWQRDSEVHPQRGPLQGMLWSGTATPVIDHARVLPVVDPIMDDLVVDDIQYYRNVARRQRNEMAERYRRDWNREKVGVFDDIARMSQFYTLWNGFTRAQLNQLQNENQLRNLPFVIETHPEVIYREQANPRWDLGSSQAAILIGKVREGDAFAMSAQDRILFLDERYMFVGVAYWKPIQALLPGLFNSPLQPDNITYAQLMLFAPRRRLVWNREDYGHRNAEIQNQMIHQDEQQDAPLYDLVHYSRGHSVRWDLLNQNWTVQLVPATHHQLATMLTEQPPLDGEDQQPTQEVEPLDLSGMAADDLPWISHH